MILRPYQQDLYDRVRVAFSQGHKSVLMQLCTGGGKTPIFSVMTDNAEKKGLHIWIVAPRKKLVRQISKSLSKVGVKHGRIAPRFKESKAFNVHVVSRDTWTRRKDKLKITPDFVIIDEAHLSLDRYKEFRAYYPKAFFLGVTATPELLNGRGLDELWEVLVLGPPMRELVELGYLSNMTLYAPPIGDIDLEVETAGTEYHQENYEKYLQKNKIYDNAIKLYTEHAKGRKCLVYCRNLKTSKSTAAMFNAAGYRFADIDGDMTDNQQEKILEGLENGDLDGVTSCELVTYGLDIPAITCVIMMRRTQSRALYFQMLGRGLRTDELDLILLDMVGNFQIHCAEIGHPFNPVNWRFTAKEKRKKRKKDPTAILRLCPDLDYQYCDKPSCVGCEFNKGGRKERKVEQDENVKLVKVKNVRLKDRPPEEKREFVDRISMAIEEYKGTQDLDALRELLAIAAELGNPPLWVYNQICEGRITVNVPLLHAISKIKKYKPGWAWMQKNRIGQRC
jgi:superfamily II DNA or RNA helicase